MITALLYVRVSTEEQARDGLSLDTQLSECQRYAARLGCVLGSVYTDVMSGTRDGRPDYQRLLTDVRQFRAQGIPLIVVTAALDRFGRRLLERVRSRDELKSLGVAVHSVREGGEVSDLVANVLGAVAQEEVRRLGERVKASRDYMRERGWHVPGNAAWGYRWRPPTQAERELGAPAAVLDLDHDAAPYVRELFRLVGDGMSTRAAGRWVASLPQSARGPYRLGHQAVQRALHRDTYLARPPARWPALVDEDTWQRVQAHIAGHEDHAHQATGRYLLTGFVRCPRCGGAVYGRYHQQQAERYYRCAIDQAGGQRGCGNWSAHASSLEQAVLQEVSLVIERLQAMTPTGLANAHREIERPDEIAGYRASRIAKFRRDAEQARDRLTKAALLLVDGVLDRGGYDLLRDNAQAELTAAEAEVARLRGGPTRRPAPSLTALTVMIAAWNDAVGPATQRAVLAEMVARVHPTRIGRGRYRVALTWTDLGAGLQAISEAREPRNVAGLAT